MLLSRLFVLWDFFWFVFVFPGIINSSWKQKVEKQTCKVQKQRANMDMLSSQPWEAAEMGCHHPGQEGHVVGADGLSRSAGKWPGGKGQIFLIQDCVKRPSGCGSGIGTTMAPSGLCVLPGTKQCRFLTDASADPDPCATAPTVPVSSCPVPPCQLHAPLLLFGEHHTEKQPHLSDP